MASSPAASRCSSMSGAKMEDAFVPAAVDAHGKKMTMMHFIRLTMLLANESPPSTPLIKWQRTLGFACLAVFRFFGVKPFAPVFGWDAA